MQNSVLVSQRMGSKWGMYWAYLSERRPERLRPIFYILFLPECHHHLHGTCTLNGRLLYMVLTQYGRRNANFRLFV